MFQFLDDEGEERCSLKKEREREKFWYAVKKIILILMDSPSRDDFNENDFTI